MTTLTHIVHREAVADHLHFPHRCATTSADVHLHHDIGIMTCAEEIAIEHHRRDEMSCRGMTCLEESLQEIRGITHATFGMIIGIVGSRLLAGRHCPGSEIAVPFR